jgi:hypothetical protein
MMDCVLLHLKRSARLAFHQCRAHQHQKMRAFAMTQGRLMNFAPVTPAKFTPARTCVTHSRRVKLFYPFTPCTISCYLDIMREIRQSIISWVTPHLPPRFTATKHSARNLVKCRITYLYQPFSSSSSSPLDRLVQVFADRSHLRHFLFLLFLPTQKQKKNQKKHAGRPKDW